MGMEIGCVAVVDHLGISLVAQAQSLQINVGSNSMVNATIVKGRLRLGAIDGIKPKEAAQTVLKYFSEK